MPDIEALKRAILAESVYNLVNLRGDRRLAGIPEALLAVWDPGPIEVTAETVTAATKQLVAERHIELRWSEGGEALAAAALIAAADVPVWITIPNRGPNGRASVLHVDYQAGELRRGPPK
jgi:hypothetical protein